MEPMEGKADNSEKAQIKKGNNDDVVYPLRIVRRPIAEIQSSCVSPTTGLAITLAGNGFRRLKGHSKIR